MRNKVNRAQRVFQPLKNLLVTDKKDNCSYATTLKEFQQYVHHPKMSPSKFYKATFKCMLAPARILLLSLATRVPVERVFHMHIFNYFFNLSNRIKKTVIFVFDLSVPIETNFPLFLYENF